VARVCGPLIPLASTALRGLLFSAARRWWISYPAALLCPLLALASPLLSRLWRHSWYYLRQLNVVLFALWFVELF